MVRQFAVSLAGVLVVLVAGCGFPQPDLDRVARETRSRLERINVGMTEREVHDLMGRGSVTYRVHPLDSDTVSRPLRVERHEGDGDTGVVLWYHARPGYVTPEATVPVILINGRVLGRGDTVLEEYRERFGD